MEEVLKNIMKKEFEQLRHIFCMKAPKINSSMSWMVWEEQTCDQIDRLYRAIGSRVMRTDTVELD